MGMRELARHVASQSGSSNVLTVEDIRIAMQRDQHNNLDGDRGSMTQQEVHNMISRYQGWPGNGIISGHVMSFDRDHDRRLSPEEVYDALASRRGDLREWGITLQRQEPPRGARPPQAGGVSLRGSR